MNRNVLKSIGLGLSIAAAPALASSGIATPGVMFEIEETNSHTGTFVKAAEAEFTMKDDAGAAHKHKLATDAKVTDPNGQPCKISDLKEGQKIRVTTKEGDKTTAVKVECVV